MTNKTLINSLSLLVVFLLTINIACSQELIYTQPGTATGNGYLIYTRNQENDTILRLHFPKQQVLDFRLRGDTITILLEDDFDTWLFSNVRLAPGKWERYGASIIISGKPLIPDDLMARPGKNNYVSPCANGCHVIWKKLDECRYHFSMQGWEWIVDWRNSSADTSNCRIKPLLIEPIKPKKKRLKWFKKK
jgi:hypothetical protein